MPPDPPVMTPRRPLAAALVLALLVLGAERAHASGFLVPTGASEEPAPEWSLEALEVQVVVQGPHARVTVHQALRNHGHAPHEAAWLFPLPAGAIVSSFAVHGGGEVLKGELLRAAAAREAYLRIVRQRKDPALLRYLGQDLYRVDVFPIPAGEARTLVLTYDQVLASDGGVTEFMYPLEAVRLSRHPVARAVLTIDVQVRAPLGPIYSPTHDVEVVRKGRERAVIAYEGSVGTDAQDLVLYWSTTTRRIGATLLTYWPRDEPQGWFLFLAAPGVPADDDRAARPKAVTFVLDISGSMAGEKLEQVRAALQQVVGGLNDGDQFNVIAYHSAVHALWNEPRTASAEARTDALRFVDQLKASGGTNVAGALRAALAAARPADMPSVVLFLTDGRPTMGETDMHRILADVERANPARATRIFVLGVGVDVNTVLLDRLALENKGAPAFVKPRESVETKVSALYDKIRYPVLTNIVLQATALRPSDLMPDVLPDLFRGSELVVAGRYTHGGPAEMVLTGHDGTFERELHYTLTAARRGDVTSGDFPARLWAMRRIAQLVDAIRLHGNQDPELVGEIVRLSTRFGILTEYTSFLADESGVSHSALRVNTQRTQRNLDDLTGRTVGGAGLAQSANQVERRGAGRVLPQAGAWFSTPDDRDVRKVDIRGVRQVANRTFYYRGASVGWVDVGIADGQAPDEVVVRWSERFFELLDTTSLEENARLAQAGPLLLGVRGRILRVVDPS